MRVIDYSNLHPHDLVLRDDPDVDIEFRDTVLTDEETFKNYTTAYGIEQLFFDADGEYIHFQPIEDTPEFYDFVVRTLVESYSDAELSALCYTPPFTMPSTCRDASHYTQRLRRPMDDVSIR